MKILCLLFGFIPSFVFSQIDPTVVANISGTWLISDYFPAKNITNPKEQVAQYIGQPIVVSKKGVSIEGLTDSDCAFMSTHISNDASLYTKPNADGLAVLPLDTPFAVAQTACNEILYDKNRSKYIIVLWDRYFFKAVRTTNPTYNTSIYSLVGTWHVTKWLTGLSELSTSDRHSLLGKTLTINPQTISLGTLLLTPPERTCRFDSTDTAWVTNSPERYFEDNYGYDVLQEYKVLGLKIPFWTLQSTCISVLTTPDPNKIIFTFGEDFFEAVKQSEDS